MKLMNFIKEIGKDKALDDKGFNFCITEYDPVLKVDTLIHDEIGYKNILYNFFSTSLMLNRSEISIDPSKKPIKVSQSYVSEILLTTAVDGKPCKHMVIRVSNADKPIEDVLDEFNEKYEDDIYFEKYREAIKNYREEITEEKER